jgi:hypothetical protein
MSILQNNREIPEIHLIKHKHDSEPNDAGFDYSKNILKRTISPILYNNDNNELFLNKLNDLIAVMFDSVLPVRNIFFYTLDKYYNKHGK